MTLLTDFGTRDGYVAAMKGVIRSLVPGVRLDDASHDLAQGDVRGGSWALSRYWRRYPPRSVHMAVVDPGVGTGRRALAVEADGRFLVAPDNGLLTRVLAVAEEWRAVATINESYWGADRSRTFHGRDIFAPVAGHLARGVELEVLGADVTDPVRLEDPVPEWIDEGVVGEVVAVDHFGNLITNIAGSDLPTEGSTVVVVPRGAGAEGSPGDGESDVPLELSRTYGSVESGRLLALVNSAGMLEVAVRDGSASRRLDAGRGLRVEVRSGGDLPSGAGVRAGGRSDDQGPAGDRR